MSRATELTLTVNGMDCADCAAKLEKGVGRLDGVQSCRVNFTAGHMAVAYDADTADESAIVGRIRALGYSVTSEDAAQQQRGRGGILGLLDFMRGQRQGALTLAAGGLILIAFLGDLLNLPQPAVVVIYVAAAVIGGYTIAQAGIRGLWINRELDMNLLMSIAALGAMAIGAWEEAALVVFLFSFGETLEGYTMERARNSLRSLMELAPAEATRIHHGGTQRVPIETLEIGAKILVRPGERIPMDGHVKSGRSLVDQAPITGESIPVAKAPGDDVFAGTINQSGALELIVTHLAADNTLSRIIHMVAEAQTQKAPTQRWVDKFAKYYTPAVVALATLVATVPPLVFSQPFWDPTTGPHGWLYRALALLVIACPCALVISTPVSIVSAISNAARNGVLIKGGAYLEAAGTLRVVAFDKTGTLTRGQPQVSDVLCADACCLDKRAANHGSAACADCEDVLALAAAVEHLSEHPLARAITQEASARGVAGRYAAARDVTALAGRGVQGSIDGRQVTIASHRHYHSLHQHSTSFCQHVDAAESAGQTTMLIHDGAKVLGYIAVADEVRPDSADVVTRLHELGIERIVMLTGDNPSTAARIARQVGIDEVRAQLLPEDKVDAVRALREEYGQVAMVGDGVNDAPALAAATVGIAMGGAGTDQALETADIALMADDLSQLPFAVELSRSARQVIQQNVVLSLLIKAVFMALALPGLATLWMAVFADMGASLLVTLNGMRLLRK